MSHIAAASLEATDGEGKPLEPVAVPVAESAANPLLHGPVLSTLLRLSAPNVLALTAGTCVVVAETSYIGRLGVEALAAMTLVFPFIMLTMTMSGGAMGGGVASAIARALGAGETERASTLAAHALIIGTSLGFVFMIGMLLFGPSLLETMGGRGNVLAQAVAYTQIFFAGAVIPWLMNTLAGVLRGTGNMKLPSAMVLTSAVSQIILGGTLGLGLGPVPQFGMPGVAAGSLLAFSIGAVTMGWYITSGRARVNPLVSGFRIQRAMFFDILKVGAVSCLTPIQNVLTISILTHMLARFGTEVLAGYGIGARLEFMLTSIAFAIGMASVPMVGMAIGAGDVARARRIAWTAGAISFVSVGSVATVIAIFPDLWVNLFTRDPGVIAASRQYLSTAAPFYAFIGLSISLYFSSQGAAKVLPLVLVQTGRLIFIGVGGTLLMMAGASVQAFFWLATASMVMVGLSAVIVVKFTRWGS